MKTKTTKLLFTVITIVCIVCLVSCSQTSPEDLWKKATYPSDVSLGTGKTTVTIDIQLADFTTTITLKTDKSTLGDAMFEHGLINDPSFFDTLNGIKADWDKDNAYWAFYEGENMMMVGVNDTKIENGDHYRFVYTK